jgi:hypothetical protein
MGGGTTIVEGLATGRRVIGVDTNNLAHFVTRVKTTPLSEADAAQIRQTLNDIEAAYCKSEGLVKLRRDSRIRNLPGDLERFFASALSVVRRLPMSRRRAFLRCALLGVGQWALESRDKLPEGEQLLTRLRIHIDQMIRGLDELVLRSRDAGISKKKLTGHRQLIRSSAASPEVAQLIRNSAERPRLILTSPPYPGVHVLYHRWQVNSRLETPAPFWVAGLRDGHGASYYTMGSRSTHGMTRYYETLRYSFENVRSLLADDGVLVQLVAFSHAETQLPLYMDALHWAGFEEFNPWTLDQAKPLTRAVPHRRWYTHRQERGDAGSEVLLIHRPRPT